MWLIVVASFVVGCSECGTIKDVVVSMFGGFVIVVVGFSECGRCSKSIFSDCVLVGVF